MGLHENPDQTTAQRPMSCLSNPTLYKSYCLGPLHTSPTLSLGRENRVLTPLIVIASLYLNSFLRDNYNMLLTSQLEYFLSLDLQTLCAWGGAINCHH